MNVRDTFHTLYSPEQLISLVYFSCTGPAFNDRWSFDYRDCIRNFKWPFMQRWKCPIYNGTPKSFVWSSIKDFHDFVLLNCLFSFVVSLQERLWHFLPIRNNREIISNKYVSGWKNDVIFHIFDQIKVSGTVVNRALPSFLGWWHGITLQSLKDYLNVYLGERIHEVVVKSCSFTSLTVSPEGTDTLAVGSDR